jgi:hypothetical protein
MGEIISGATGVKAILGGGGGLVGVGVGVETAARAWTAGVLLAVVQAQISVRAVMSRIKADPKYLMREPRLDLWS